MHYGDPGQEVMTWIKIDDEQLAPALDVVPGVTGVQAVHLARLAALIMTKINTSVVPIALTDALRPACSIQVPSTVAESFQVLIDKEPLASLAALYAQTVSATNRRVLGTFFTPLDAARAMVRDYAGKFPTPELVVDIGAGVGVFSQMARTQWEKARVQAIDINPVTLGLQAIALPRGGEDATSLILGDFADWVSGFRPTGPVLYLGNPPYTRWQLIPLADRSRLIDYAEGLVEPRANLSTIFLAIAVKRLRPEDALCLIVPASWMTARYAQELRAFIREQRYRSVRLRFADAWRFDGAIVDAVVVEIGPESAAVQPLAISSWFGETVVEQNRATNDRSPIERLIPHPRRGCEYERGYSSDRLGDFVRITRGVATGANRFFVLTANEAREQGINERWLAPLARRIRAGSTASSPIVECAFLLTLANYNTGQDAGVDMRIVRAELKGLQRGYLCSKRSRWFDLTGEVRRPDVILTSLGRDKFHVHDNVHQYAITNNLFGLQWADGVDNVQKERVLSWLRSEDGQRSLLLSSTIEANGLHRLSPRALEGIPVPRERHLDSQNTDRHSSQTREDSNVSV